MPKTATDKLKTVQFEMLEVFSGHCRRKKYHYFLIGNALLGAARHRGFLPAEDGIEVGMPRPDYNRFMKTAQVDLPKKFFLQTYKTDRHYHQCYAKIRNNNTTCIEEEDRQEPIHHGAYISVYPLDGAAATCGFRSWNIHLSRTLAKAQNAKYRKKQPGDGILSSGRRLLAKLLPGKVLFRLADTLAGLCNFEKGPWAGYLFGKRFPVEIEPAAWYGKGKRLPFEGKDFPVPEQWENYLTALYGDYLTLPPEEIIAVPRARTIDVNKSYLLYRQEK